MTEYLLTLGATTQPPADWVAFAFRLSLSSLSVDSLAFTIAAPVDELPAFAHGDPVVLQRDGVRLFAGRIETIDPQGSGRTERLALTCVGPWSYLERTTLRSTWQFGNGTDDTLGDQSLTRIIVGQDEAGAKITLGAHIAAALAHAIARGAALQAGAVDLDVTTPYQELLDVTIAEFIRAVVRWVPDVQSWFDYTTTPPTLHLQRRAAFATVARAATACEQFNVRPRPDLRAAGVQLYFESSYQYNEDTYKSATTQAAGVTTGENVVEATISLGGSGVTVEEQKLKVRAINEASVQFWRDTLGALASVSTADLEVSSGAIAESDDEGLTWFARTLPNFLIKGSVSEWMNVTTRKCRGRVKVKYTGTDATLKKILGANVERWHTLDGFITAASTFTYRRTTSSWVGETEPAGLAAAMYAAMSVLHYEGSITLAAQECDFALRPGQLLNLTGALPAWGTMAAGIQQVQHALDRGRTVVQFGPPGQLGPQEFLQLLRGNRTSQLSWRLSERTSGKSGGNGRTAGGEIQPVKDSTAIGGGFNWVPLTHAITVAGVVPTAAEINTALAAVYTDPTPDTEPADGDAIVLTVSGVPKFNAVVSLAPLTASGIYLRSFVVGSTTYYATLTQCGLY